MLYNYFRIRSLPDADFIYTLEIMLIYLILGNAVTNSIKTNARVHLYIFFYVNKRFVKNYKDQFIDDVLKNSVEFAVPHFKLSLFLIK